MSRATNTEIYPRYHLERDAPVIRRGHDLSLFSLVTWAGSTLAAFSLLGNVQPQPAPVAPLSPPAWAPNQLPQIGAAPPPAPTQPTSNQNPLSPFAQLQFEGAARISRENIGRERFKSYGREFVGALKEYQFDRAVEMLMLMMSEVDSLPDNVQHRAIGKVAERADLLACKIFRIMKRDGFMALSEEAAQVFERLLQNLDHRALQAFRGYLAAA